MENFSTLIYVVNSFQYNKRPVCNDEVEGGIEKSLIPMDAEPSESLIKNILDFARSYDTLKTESTGYVEMNLN